MSLLPINHHFLASPWIPDNHFWPPVDGKCYFCHSSSVMYLCEECHVYVCKECCSLPSREEESPHWLHPQHSLYMNIDHEAGKGICDACHCLLWCHVYYKCRPRCCEFCLCVECFRSSRTNRRPPTWEKEKEKKTRSHYSHRHDLTRCRFREDIEDCKCAICEDRMWGVGYACLKCNHFIHESCLETEQIIEAHPLHPSHSLERHDNNPLSGDSYRCDCCNLDFKNQDYPFGCEDCGFYIHSRCARVGAVKLDYHEHGLRCLPKPYGTNYYMSCCDDYSMFEFEPYLGCVQCRVRFHVKCVHLPPKFDHFAHHHTLTLTHTHAFSVYASEEYYCDVCEATRDVRLPAYCCKRCNFFAHIECALSKEEQIPRALLTSKLTKADVMKRPGDSSNKQIHPFLHNHPLSFQQNVTNKFCQRCRLEIIGQAYKCEISCDDDKFWVHERCAMLPEDLDHPLHPDHKLGLLRIYKHFPTLHICSLCREVIEDFSYTCRICDFAIDIKCAFLDQEGNEGLTEFNWKSTLKHLFHSHELGLVIQFNTSQEGSLCRICGDPCFGRLAYYCLRRCSVSFHIDCLYWPSIIMPHVLHPRHILKLFGESEGLTGKVDCLACGQLIKSHGWYKCGNPYPRCSVFFHTQCARAPVRFLKYEHHSHILYYLNKPPSWSAGTCSLCGEEAKKCFYRCVECKLFFHLRCLRPHAAKHKRHIHTLNFRDSTDLGGYYCDVCEEPRDSEYPVYCCEVCDFVTHVECIASEENASNVTLEEIEDEP